MKKNLFKFILFFFIICQLESLAEEKNYHKELITDWSRIFPDQNRNAAGPKFFKYIIDKEITYKDFKVEVKWTNGKKVFIDKIKLNQTITIKQK